MRVSLWICRCTAAVLCALFCAAVLLLAPQLFGLRILPAADGALCFVSHSAPDRLEAGQTVLIADGETRAVGTLLRLEAAHAQVAVSERETAELPYTSIEGSVVFQLAHGADMLRVLAEPAVLLAFVCCAVPAVLGVILLPRRIYKPKYGRGRSI